jgi:hypothetical protein
VFFAAAKIIYSYKSDACVAVQESGKVSEAVLQQALGALSNTSSPDLSTENVDKKICATDDGLSRLT